MKQNLYALLDKNNTSFRLKRMLLLTLFLAISHINFTKPLSGVKSRVTLSAKNTLNSVISKRKKNTRNTQNLVIPDQIIYDDALSGDWQNFSTIFSLNFSNATLPFINTNSIKVTNPTANEVLDLRYSGLPLNTADYPLGLGFWVYNSGIDPYPIQVQTFENASGANQSLVAGFSINPNAWTYIQIDWSQFGNPVKIGKFTIKLTQTQAESLYFDEMRILSCVDMYSVKNGIWNDPTVWSCGRVPIITDEFVTINPTHTISVPNGVSATVRFLVLLGTLNPLLGSTFNFKKF